ncbi:hypothetical protein HMPREF0185_00091 [Brevundimonas diminuta 470-4]|nr:hypothetical protein HMPREF0185_00091 [Brevundimonas diminuta 470-4]
MSDGMRGDDLRSPDAADRRRSNGGNRPWGEGVSHNRRRSFIAP